MSYITLWAVQWLRLLCGVNMWGTQHSPSWTGLWPVIDVCKELYPLCMSFSKSSQSSFCFESCLLAITTKPFTQVCNLLGRVSRQRQGVIAITPWSRGGHLWDFDLSDHLNVIALKPRKVGWKLAVKNW